MDGKLVAQAQVSSTSYFADEEGLIEEFQFDYDSLNAFDQAIVRTNAVPFSCLFLFTGLPIFPCFIPYMFICETQNVVDKNNATHVCITQDGIRYSVDRRKAGCRMSMCDQGRTMKTVPFDKITDCDIEEPAGNSGCCWLVKNTVTVVNVDTASGNRVGEAGAGLHELQIRGLVDPQAFKKLVWKMKRGGHGTPHQQTASKQASAVPPSRVEMSRVAKGDELAPLLKKQIALLETQNKALNEQTKLLKIISDKK